jgi:hypothetical protein
MPDKPFVINDRRKFTAEGELRPDVPHEPRPAAESQPAAEAQPEPPAPAEAAKGPQLVTEPAAKPELALEPDQLSEDQLPPPPTQEQTEQAARAYDATVDRLDTAVRAMDPGAQHAPPMSFERLVQSLYMQTLMQLGGLAPDPNQPVQVDILGARATIDMLGVIEEKTRGNLSDSETKLVQSALFELRLGFLDVTQALARQAAQRTGQPAPGAPPAGGPSIIR